MTCLVVSTYSAAAFAQTVDDLLNAGAIDGMSDAVEVPASDDYWPVTSTPGNPQFVSFRLTAAFSAFNNTTRFGIYDKSDPTNRLEIFDGWDSSLFDPTPMPGLPFGTPLTGYPETVLVSIDGFNAVNLTTGLDITLGANDEFGFYLDSSAGGVGGGPGGDLFFSDNTENDTDAFAEHMRRFIGPAVGELVVVSPLEPDPLELFGPTTAQQSLGGVTYNGLDQSVLFWEDLNQSFTDNDFTDFVVVVNNVPIPEPSTFVLLGAGLLALARVRKSHSG